MNENLIIVKKCVVDVDNIFQFGNIKMHIDENDKNYKVINSYRDLEDYSNHAQMTFIYVCLCDKTNRLFFVNEKFEIVKNVKVVM